MKYLKTITLILILLVITSCSEKEKLSLKDDYYTYINKETIKDYHH